MKITVLGCGSIGKLWLSAFFFRGYNVQGWLRIPKSTLKVGFISLKNKKIFFQVPCNDLDHLYLSDLLLVTLKAKEIVKALNFLLPHLHPNCVILLLHNGMGIYDSIIHKIQQPIISGVTSHSAFRNKEFVVHTYAGVTCIGSIKGDENTFIKQKILHILNLSLPKVIWNENIKLLHWIKLSVNCVINPLTALGNCRNGDILRLFPKEIKSIVQELSIITKYEGYNIKNNELASYIIKIIRNTKNNFSSMLQDVKNNRISEIDYINGYIIKLAKIYNVNVPQNKKLFNFIKEKEVYYE